jgi:hypothetical protein
MIEFEQGMFDRVKFDFREAGPGKVAAHVWKRGHTCQFIIIPLNYFDNPDVQLWQYIYDQAVIKWVHEKEISVEVCPNCGLPMKDIQRMYHGRRFCVNCGGALEGKDHV